MGVEVACITHGHNLSVIASYHFVSILAYLARNNIESLKKLCRMTLQATIKHFSQYDEVWLYQELILKSLDLASDTSLDDRLAIHTLGEGWVAEETVAIALYCFLKYYGDPKKALTVSVNHKGDSDSTGILTGNLLGLILDSLHSYQSVLERIDAYGVIDSMIL